MPTIRKRTCTALAAIALAASMAPASATDILFIGNSFTHGNFALCIVWTSSAVKPKSMV